MNVCVAVSLSRLIVNSLHAKTVVLTIDVSIVGGQTCVCVRLCKLIWKLLVLLCKCVVFCVLTVEVDNVVVELIGEQRLWQFSEEHL